MTELHRVGKKVVWVHFFKSFLAYFRNQRVECLDVLFLSKLIRVDAGRLVHVEAAERCRRFENVGCREKHSLENIR